MKKKKKTTNIGLTWRLIILCVIHKLVKNDLSTETIASDGATIRTITLCIHTNRSLNPKLITRLHKSNGQNERKTGMMKMVMMIKGIHNTKTKTILYV